MNAESYVRAMPKVELGASLEGLVRKEAWLSIAEQNEIPDTDKQFGQWAGLLENPDYRQLDNLVQALLDWLQYPEDLTRLVYDAGVALANQNVKYAEIHLNPSLLMLPGMAFDEFMSAIDDGRGRAERGWDIRMAWVLTVSRDQPRRADDTLRWIASPTGKKSSIVAYGLVGQEDIHPAGQFERAFAAAQKKDIPTIAQAGGVLGGEGVLDVLQQLNPSRIIDGWGAAESPDVQQLLREHDVPIVASMARALCHNWTGSYSSYPLQHLFDENIKVVLSASHPTFYKASLSDEYLAATEHCGLAVDDMDEIALNAIRYSYLPDEDKSALIADFAATYKQLRAKHIDSPTLGAQ